MRNTAAEVQFIAGRIGQVVRDGAALPTFVTRIDVELARLVDAAHPQPAALPDYAHHFTGFVVDIQAERQCQAPLTTAPAVGAVLAEPAFSSTSIGRPLGSTETSFNRYGLRYGTTANPFLLVFTPRWWPTAA
ncbi:hypothetical protein G6F50_016681 [Rhizopus delemar]|uniref:Uncharacterized protein n=1 Tax=Rhizopus delemar TaxID=936053 RepID=A0A9P6XS73_9FUNG|nr:hypothetical protein G6F50_016681 [Rhizopus delemar]